MTGNRTLSETKCTDNVAGIKKASIKIETGVSTSCASYLSQDRTGKGKRERKLSEQWADVYIKYGLLHNGRRLQMPSAEISTPWNK
jgi:hypothetical protein